MILKELLADKSLKPKEKTERINRMLLNKEIKTVALIDFAIQAKDPDKATCIEALELASRAEASIVDLKCFGFIVNCLTEKAPRIKWEAAKVTGNTVYLFPDKLDNAISNLLTNSEHTGTVVRWAAAFALGEIVKLDTKHNKDLIPAIEAIIKREEKNSIKKIYLAALKKTG